MELAGASKRARTRAKDRSIDRSIERERESDRVCERERRTSPEAATVDGAGASKRARKRAKERAREKEREREGASERARERGRAMERVCERGAPVLRALPLSELARALPVSACAHFAKSFPPKKFASSHLSSGNWIQLLPHEWTVQTKNGHGSWPERCPAPGPVFRLSHFPQRSSSQVISSRNWSHLLPQQDTVETKYGPMGPGRSAACPRPRAPGVTWGTSLIRTLPPPQDDHRALQQAHARLPGVSHDHCRAKVEVTTWGVDVFAHVGGNNSKGFDAIYLKAKALTVLHVPHSLEEGGGVVAHVRNGGGRQLRERRTGERD